MAFSLFDLARISGAHFVPFDLYPHYSYNLMAVQNGKSNSQAEAEHYRANRRSPRRRVFRLREMPINNF